MNQTARILEHIVEVTREISINGPECKTAGICWHVVSDLFDSRDDDVRVANDLLDYYAKSWDGFSGNECFPVPDPNGVMSPDDMYYHAIEVGQTWTGSTYSALRWDLLLHIMREAKRDLKRLTGE